MNKKKFTESFNPFFLIFFFFLFKSLTGSAQDCIFTLQAAEKLYTQGLIEEIPQMLEPCIRRGLSKEDKVQALKLVILSELFDDNLQEAENKMLSFLRQYPEYELTPADVAEFIFLFESYEVLPLFSVGGTFGANISLNQVIENFGASDLNEYSGNYLLSGVGLQGGLYINRYIYKNLGVSFEVLYTQNIYNFQDKIPYEATTNSYGIIDYEETLTTILVPLTLTYDFYTPTKWDPYIRGGFGTGLLMDAKSSLVRDYEGTGSVQLAKIKGSDIAFKNSRKDFNFWAVLGGGVKFKIPHSYIMMDLRYNFGLNNIVERENRYSQDEQPIVFDYHYEGNDFRLDNITFSVGWVYTFYKPVKSTLRKRQ
jgi:hypothetical protein